MRAPAFYWDAPGTLSALLAPVGALYGAMAAARMRRAGASGPVPVLCVGDPTVGGAGKTPTALALARILADRDEQPFLLARGYGGFSRGPLRVDPERHTATEVGDEALLLARAFPTVVAADRPAGARAAAEAGATVLLLDDGFQNPALAKDLSLLVVDAAFGLGNRRVLPAGPLRAPLAAQLAHAHALVLVGEGPHAATARKDAAQHSLPVLSAKLVPEVPVELRGQSALAFAGIGHPEKFFASLERTGVDVAERRAFGDHHRYSAAEADSLLSAARKRSLALVTTEKDLARMRGEPELAALARTARAVPARMEFQDEAALLKLIASALERARA